MNDWLDRVTAELGNDGQLSDDDSDAQLKICLL
jgi:hypothetical protein